MNRTFHLAMTVLLSCSFFSSAQTAPPPTEQKSVPPAASTDKKQEPPVSSSNTQAPTQPDATRAGEDYGLGVGRKANAAMGPVEVLTDLMGVDFGPYLQRVLHDVRTNWYNLIPESAKSPMRKKGKVVIEFAILKDGKIAGMQLVRTSGDVGLDRGAWEGITASNPFPPLPTEFGGKYIGLRFAFWYNPDEADFAGAHASPTGQSSSKSGIKVSISQPYGAEVPIGESVTVVATVTGSTNTAVKWSITGADCSGSSCGRMSGDLYVAPKVSLSPKSVVLTATSKADKTASAWVTVHVVKPGTSHATQMSPSGAPPVDRGSASATETVVRLSEILIGTPQPYNPAQIAEAQHKAEQVRAAIGRGRTFADIARANSQGPTAAQGGDLGCFTHGKLAPPLEELVFQMKVDDVSDVVQTKQGFVILEVTDRGADSCADLELLKH
jgi:TonB family protein